MLSFITILPPLLQVLHQLENGGMFWFCDLTAKDSTMALPLLAITATYGAIQIAFSRIGMTDNNGGGKNTGNMNFVTFLKDTVQTVIILSIPVVHALPAGVFCYWIPSSLFGACQSIALRTALGQSILKIPPQTPNLYKTNKSINTKK